MVNLLLTPILCVVAVYGCGTTKRRFQGARPGAGLGPSDGGPPDGRRRLLPLAEDGFQEELACKAPMEAARQIRDQLHRIVANGRESSQEPRGGSLGLALEKPVARVQRACFHLAKKSIRELGVMLQKEPSLRSNLTEEADETKSQATHLFKTILDSKQCLAYLELARRSGEPEILLRAWLNSDKDSRQRDHACGNLVNAVNAHLADADIPGGSAVTAGSATNKQELMLIEEFPLGDRLRVAEEKAGLSRYLAEALAISSAMTGSMMAGLCRLWEGQNDDYVQG